MWCLINLEVCCIYYVRVYNMLLLNLFKCYKYNSDKETVWCIFYNKVLNDRRFYLFLLVDSTPYATVVTWWSQFVAQIILLQKCKL